MTKKCNSKQVGFNLILSCFTSVAFFFLVTFIYLSNIVCLVFISIEIVLYVLVYAGIILNFVLLIFQMNLHG